MLWQHASHTQRQAALDAAAYPAREDDSLFGDWLASTHPGSTMTNLEHLAGLLEAAMDADDSPA